MLAINSLKEISAKLKENQMLMKSASNEFILREKTNDKFFASGKSIYLDRYAVFLYQLQNNTDEIEQRLSRLNGMDRAELQNLKTSIKSYNEVFVQMVEKIKIRGYGRYGLIGEFEKSIEDLLQYNFGTDKMAVLNLQLFVKNYLLTGDENISNNVSNEIYTFTLVLEKHIRDEEVGKVSNILFNYETVFLQLVEVDRELGIYTGKGLQSNLFASSDNFDKAVHLEKINIGINEAYSNILIKLYLSFFLIVSAAMVAAYSINKRLHKTLVVPIHEMKSIIAKMSRGEVPKAWVRFKVEDLNEMAQALNNLVTGTRTYQDFANNIGRGNLDTTFIPLSDKDILGMSLLAMRENLKTNISEQHNQMLELQRVNAELDNFTYHASHDLRAPLSSIQGLVNLGLNETANNITRTYFEMIQGRVNHMDSLLKDLISISYNNKTETKYEVFDFKAEVNSLLKSLEHPEHEFEIQLDIQQNSSFMSDPIRIRTILANLLSNAFKYYNPDVQKNYIGLNVCVDSQVASIVIKDNGIGIDHTYAEKIYNMFFRATTRSTGTGLGLYIVKTMIDRLKGKISFESRLNEGTTFQVTIPNQRSLVSSIH
jgi:signal transduction histidine kinase